MDDKLDKLHEMAEDEDIGVYFKKMSKTLKGYSILFENCYDIFINDSLNDKEMLHSTAHEMGHINGNMCFEWKSDFLKVYVNAGLKNGR